MHDIPLVMYTNFIWSVIVMLVRGKNIMCREVCKLIHVNQKLTANIRSYDE